MFRRIETYVLESFKIISKGIEEGRGLDIEFIYDIWPVLLRRDGEEHDSTRSSFGDRHLCRWSPASNSLSPCTGTAGTHLRIFRTTYFRNTRTRRRRLARYTIRVALVFDGENDFLRSADADRLVGVVFDSSNRARIFGIRLLAGYSSEVGKLRRELIPFNSVSSFVLIPRSFKS